MNYLQEQYWKHEVRWAARLGFLCGLATGGLIALVIMMICFGRVPW